jgi:uncharacterized protein (TIGR00369 family)
MTTTELTGLQFLKLANTQTGAQAHIGSLIGLRIDKLEYGDVTMSLHGGICATLLDAAMGCAVHTTLEAGVGFGTLDLTVNYIRPVAVDGVHLTATAHTIHRGGKTATAEGRIHDPQGRLVAHGTTTCIIHR